MNKDFKVGDEFSRPGFNTDIRISGLKTHSKEGSKSIKLADPIYTIEYVASDRSPFTTYRKHIISMIGFGRWIKK